MTQPVALLLSILVEAAAAAALLRGLGWASPLRGAAAAVAGTLVTHWAVWAFMPLVIEEIGYWPALLIVEGVVVLAETLAYRVIAQLPWRRAFLTSLVANAVSTLAGLAIYAVRASLR